MRHSCSENRNRILTATVSVIYCASVLSFTQKWMLDKRRIYDRILEMCTPMYVGGTSKREAIASMKMEKAKTLLNTKNDRVYCG